MPSAGQFIVRDDGTIGLSSDGRANVFTTGGECDECCGVDCPPTLKLTLTNVDAAACCSDPYFLDPPGVDGVYLLTRTSALPNVSGDCFYDYSEGGHDMPTAAFPGCVLIEIPRTGVRVFNITYNPSTGKVKYILVKMFGGGFVPAVGFDTGQFEATVTADLGDVIANQLVNCGATSGGLRSLVPGGSAEVDLP